MLLRNYADPAMALAYLERMDDLPDHSFAYSNNLRGLCLIELGRKREALSCFRQEVRAYPISLVALYNLLRLERDLGLEEASRHTAERLDWALMMKGLKPADLPNVLANPTYDLDFLYYEGRNGPVLRP